MADEVRYCRAVWGETSCVLQRCHDSPHLGTAGGATVMWTDGTVRGRQRPGDRLVREGLAREGPAHEGLAAGRVPEEA